MMKIIMIRESVINRFILLKLEDLYLIVIFIALLISLFAKNKLLVIRQMLIDKLRQTKNKDFRNIMQTIIAIFSNNYISLIVTLVFPLILSKFNSDFFVIMMWILVVLLNNFCVRYDAGINGAKKWFLTSLTEIRVMENKVKNQFSGLETNIKNLVGYVNQGIPHNDLNNSFKFSEISKIACDSIYDIINKVTGYENHQVTLFYKEYYSRKKCDKLNCDRYNVCSEKENKDFYLEMIAFSNKNEELPGSFGKKQCSNYHIVEINNDQHKKKYYHYMNLMKNNFREINVLKGKLAVQDVFLHHIESANRESQLSCYIGIPLISQDQNLSSSVSNDRTTTPYGILQIDFIDEDILGKTTLDISNLVKNVFGPICSYLEKYYIIEKVLVKLFATIKTMNEMNKNEVDENEKLQLDFNNLVDEYNDLVRKFESNMT